MACSYSHGYGCVDVVLRLMVIVLIHAPHGLELWAYHKNYQSFS